MLSLPALIGFTGLTDVQQYWQFLVNDKIEGSNALVVKVIAPELRIQLAEAEGINAVWVRARCEVKESTLLGGSTLLDLGLVFKYPPFPRSQLGGAHLHPVRGPRAAQLHLSNF